MLPALKSPLTTTFAAEAAVAACRQASNGRSAGADLDVEKGRYRAAARPGQSRPGSGKINPGSGNNLRQASAAAAQRRAQDRQPDQRSNGRFGW
ncbi:MAG: hypothetical protein ACOYO0_02125 [Sandarakinorhabdus sp.]